MITYTSLLGYNSGRQSRFSFNPCHSEKALIYSFYTLFENKASCTLVSLSQGLGSDFLKTRNCQRGGGELFKQSYPCFKSGCFKQK